MLKNFQKERESDIQRRAAPLKPIVRWMEGFTLLRVRSRRFLLLISPSCLAGISQVWPKAKPTGVVWALRFSKVRKEIRGIFKNSPKWFSHFSQCPHIVYKNVGHIHAFQLSFVNCGLKSLRLLVVHIIIYVSVIHIFTWALHCCALPMTIKSSIDEKMNWFCEN